MRETKPYWYQFNPTDNHNCKVLSNLENIRLHGRSRKGQAGHLVTEEPRTPQLYLFPKIHKNISPVLGRLIVSANESLTERTSVFVDHFLSPIAKTGRSYIRDTKIRSHARAETDWVFCTELAGFLHERDFLILFHHYNS